MSMSAITELIDGTFPDPNGGDGATLSVPVKSVIIADSLDGDEVEAVKQLGFEFPLAVVSDPLTHKALGSRVERALESLGAIIKVRLDDHPHADMETAERLIIETAQAGGLIAVGSGTINDLCKLAAARQNKPCAVFATAPSMNGYTSVNAAITDRGLKKSIAAVSPEGVFMDLRVLADAPVRMIRSGLGDSVCRPTAQADWLLAHLLFNSNYVEAPFQFLVIEEEGLFAEPEALVSGDLEAMGRLARTLVLSGMGMTVCGGSYPASQGEHLISHYIEMMHPPEWRNVFHGEQIAVTTLVMARLQEQLLSDTSPAINSSHTLRGDIVKHFGLEIGNACWDEYKLKQLDKDRADKLNARLSETWPEICEKIKAITIPPDTIACILKRAGAPLTHSDIGLDQKFFLNAICHAHEIRNRYTFLDFANDTGKMNANSLI